MKVKSLYPIIASQDPKAAAAFYKTLGFEIKHDVITKMDSHVYVLSNGEQEMEIMQAVSNDPVNIPAGLYGLRMNVDDIDVATEELKQTGATIVAGPITTASGNKNLLIKDNQGINITLIQHIKKEEINNEELHKVAGGSFSSAASDWYNRNYNEIYSRVAAKGDYGTFYLLIEEIIIKDARQYSISDVKSMIKQYVGINVDDLN